jgi:tetratricopeptide (TPR) repeat protein
MVYSMDVNSEVSRARHIQFDKEADEEVLQRSQPRELTGLDLAEARLADGDVADARAMAEKVLADHADTPASIAQCARADFILARVALLSGQPQQAIEDFQKTLATSKENRQLAWSHIYLGRLLDLECNRPAALAEYNEAMAVRDWQQDTRLAAERGLKQPFTVPGHSCAEDATDDSPGPAPVKPAPQ